MGNHCNICSFNCWGREGYDASCCTLEDRNWIIGPHTDSEAFLGRLSDRIGRKVEFQEVFYDYEEGCPPIRKSDLTRLMVRSKIISSIQNYDEWITFTFTPLARYHGRP